jgi:hypothetical protein
VSRPDLARGPSAKGSVVTDGMLALTTLQPCQSINVAPQPMQRVRRSMATLITRRVVMESRHYITRGNPYYWAYRGTRRIFGKRTS